MSKDDPKTVEICKDWCVREFSEMVQLNILKISEFLNSFDISTRYKLASINERLNKLERQISFLEAFQFQRHAAPYKEE